MMEKSVWLPWRAHPSMIVCTFADRVRVLTHCSVRDERTSAVCLTTPKTLKEHFKKQRLVGCCRALCVGS